MKADRSAENGPSLDNVESDKLHVTHLAFLSAFKPLIASAEVWRVARRADPKAACQALAAHELSIGNIEPGAVQVNDQFVQTSASAVETLNRHSQERERQFERAAQVLQVALLAHLEVEAFQRGQARQQFFGGVWLTQAAEAFQLKRTACIHLQAQLRTLLCRQPFLAHLRQAGAAVGARSEAQAVVVPSSQRAFPFRQSVDSSASRRSHTLSGSLDAVFSCGVDRLSKQARGSGIAAATSASAAPAPAVRPGESAAGVLKGAHAAADLPRRSKEGKAESEQDTMLALRLHSAVSGTTSVTRRDAEENEFVHSTDEFLGQRVPNMVDFVATASSTNGSRSTTWPTLDTESSRKEVHLSKFEDVVPTGRQTQPIAPEGTAHTSRGRLQLGKSALAAPRTQVTPPRPRPAMSPASQLAAARPAASPGDSLGSSGYLASPVSPIAGSDGSLGSPISLATPRSDQKGGSMSPPRRIPNAAPRSGVSSLATPSRRAAVSPSPPRIGVPHRPSKASHEGSQSARERPATPPRNLVNPRAVTPRPKAKAHAGAAASRPGGLTPLRSPRFNARCVSPHWAPLSSRSLSPGMQVSDLDETLIELQRRRRWLRTLGVLDSSNPAMEHRIFGHSRHTWRSPEVPG